MVFWVIPTLALVPLKLFPNQLLFLIIIGGVINANLAALLGGWVYRDNAEKDKANHLVRPAR